MLAINFDMKCPLAILLLILQFYQPSVAFRPAFEDDADLCPFTNKPTVNGVPTEMTPRIEGMKYFRRANSSRERVSYDKAASYCRMYNLELAEILDQDDYNEAITLVRETGWSFWIAVRGKHMPSFGPVHFDFKLADGLAKLGFHDFGPQDYDDRIIDQFHSLREGCAMIEPNNAHASGVAWAKELCFQPRDILCQYKKSCYKRTDYIKDPTRSTTPLIPLKLTGEDESGYSISTSQATWPFAKQVCEDAGKSLLWFDDEAENDAFANRMLIFTRDKAKYNGKAVWTAGRFSPSSTGGTIYSKLYWWKGNIAYEVHDWNVSVARRGEPEHSGGFEKTWGVDQEMIQSQQREPYDEGGTRKEKCVDAIFAHGGTYFTSKCDGHLRHFVCRDQELVKRAVHRPDAPLPSHLEYCDGNKLHFMKRKDCSGSVVFARDGKPNCTCYSGVHALMADGKCKPRLLVGQGCTKLRAKTALHWKMLPSTVIHKNQPWVIGVHGGGEDFEWFALDTNASVTRQIIGGATLFLFGAALHRNLKQEKHELCLVVNEEAPNDEYFEYGLHDLPSYELTYHAEMYNCSSPQIPYADMTAHPIGIRTSDCELSCPHGDNSTGRSRPPDREPGSCAGDGTCDDNDVHSDPSPPNREGKAFGDVGDVNDNVNRQLLIYAVEMAFQHFSGPSDSLLTGPRNSWILLERLFELAKQTCHRIVSPQFLNRVLKYFKIAHFGENFDYGEYFSESEMKEILALLDSCHERASRYREMEVEVDSCSGKAARVTLENKTREIISRSSDDRGYQAVFHHHVMEATWNVVDLWNAVCINEFRSSYLLYHHMERGMEILFNDKLKKLWHFPNVTEAYFQKLLGPDEGTQLLNLDQCVSATYNSNMRISRMIRPNRGTNAVLGKMIRTRLDGDRLKKKGSPSKEVNVKMGCIRGSTVRCRAKPSRYGSSSSLVTLIRKE